VTRVVRLLVRVMISDHIDLERGIEVVTPFCYARQAHDPFGKQDEVFPWFQVIRKCGGTEEVVLDFLRSMAIATRLAITKNCLAKPQRTQSGEGAGRF
jgi:hypothetical protein